MLIQTIRRFDCHQRAELREKIWCLTRFANGLVGFLFWWAELRY